MLAEQSCFVVWVPLSFAKTAPDVFVNYPIEITACIGIISIVSCKFIIRGFLPYEIRYDEILCIIMESLLPTRRARWINSRIKRHL